MSAGLPAAGAAIGIDLGGTKVAAGVVMEGRVMHRLEAPTPAHADALTHLLVTMVQQLERQAGGRTLPVGLGVPRGPVLRGRTTFFSNLPGLNHTRLEDQLTGALNRPVAIENDANLAALAEFRYGASQGMPNNAYLTWSTGIGCGLILGGQLYPGRDRDGGGSGPHPARLPRHDGRQRDPRHARGSGMWSCAGPGRRLRLWSAGGRSAGVPAREQRRPEGPVAGGQRRRVQGLFLHNLQLLLDPDVVVLGGGLMSQAGTLLPMIENARRQTGALIDFTPLVRASLGTDAGVIGAAELGGA